jgi:hypothetical protein
VELACPAPTPLLGKTRDDLVRKVEEMGVTYRECRAAALGQ